ncbi:MAG: 5-methyltetrahydropteroyltriglutamate--homocysteine S-methyltransferase [Thermostichales cyanobacterium BF4_bins_65]
MAVQTATLGYPRIGKHRELKKALEGFWLGQLHAQALIETQYTIEQENWRAQQQAGIDHIGIGESSLYDHVLDWALRLGLVPERFLALTGLNRYFAMARGQDGIPALEMTKWFDTNYHYLVPEVGSSLQPVNFADFLETVRRSQLVLAERATPILLGPLTLLRLSRLSLPLAEVLPEIQNRYLILLTALQGLGVREVQVHEPALVLDSAPGDQELYQSTYQSFAQVGLPIQLVTYFDDLGAAYPWVVELPVAGISLDFTRGYNLDLLQQYGFPQDKILGVGIVDARNVWKLRPNFVQQVLEQIGHITTAIRIQPSAPLQFVPYDVRQETKLPDPLRNVLSFAEQKLEELGVLAQALGAGQLPQQLAQWQQEWQTFQAFSPANPLVQQRLQQLSPEDFQRPLPYEERQKLQPALPILPTTTIGSFPQTAAVRRLRVQLKRGEISQADYEAAIDAEIAKCIQIQEDLGLDVLVHGEFERTDMVEFFGQQLAGFAFTEHGWVQSYGSRCVRPPIIYGDIARPQPMTIREFKVAQSLTPKMVKGMLTGPVTMLNWSFPRPDISRRQQAMQIALALRDEVADLQAAGAKIIQIDEPALREGLPLKRDRWQEYLDWAVDAFRLAAAIARPETQIHTHMCYSEFGDIIESIERLDADVLSIENSRSNNKTLLEIIEAGYHHQVGNGVYDVHTPVVPTTAQITEQLRTGIANLPVQQIWVNPDCGLKTRRWEEVIPALKNMVAAAKILREEIHAPQP